MDTEIQLNQNAHIHADNFRNGTYSPTELLYKTLDYLEKLDTQLNAYISVMHSEATLAAERASSTVDSGEATPLTGIPIAVKDLLNTKDWKTTAASKMLSTYVPVEDSTVVARLKAAGAVIVGKTNLDEFAMGSSNEFSAFGPVKNPWDINRVPGGSSGGSAVTVASRVVPLSIGTDTGGSIRQPAAFCGVLGLKPTYGRVSRFGVVAFASSLDQVGPFARDSYDLANLLQVISGYDPKDSTSSQIPVPNFSSQLMHGLDGLTFGIPTGMLSSGIDPLVRSAFEESIKVLEANGARINRDIRLPSIEAALPVYYLIAPSEASANLARYDGVKYGHSAELGESAEETMFNTRGEGFGPEVKRRILIGTYALSAGYYDAFYLKAQKVRTVIRTEYEQALDKVDAILTPTTPTPAFELGAKLNDPLEMYLNDLYTLPANIAGLPGLSIPGGFVDGLPVGLQIVGRPFSEPTLLRIANAYQTHTDWHNQAPDVSCN
ncbi:MAG: Asp-tRNA(Asn)/Glu-tRNA(Gln) amidotransferase GatCAB subunit A [Chloroflexi bacterium]|nr:Asp-tRNA(Asn)/Glu-tRNA(Gln) amidotransferase GatCAB subunit A [Chloroflexota bacterium]